MSRKRGALIGLALAAIAAVVIHGPLASQGRVLLGLFLALTACVYLGALLAQKQTKTVAAAELAVGALVFLCSFLGVASSVLWLAAGYALHGAWDWVHDIEVVPTRVARWFPPACAIFDLAIAGFVLVFLANWQ